MLYKKISGLLIFSLCITANAQVGINTTTPTRTLDVNGDLRVRLLEDKAADPLYDKVLVKDANGNIDYWTRQDIMDAMETLYVVNKKFTASKTGPDPTTIVPCGKFEFRYNTPVMPQLRLVTAPTANLTVYYNRIRKKDGTTSTFDATNRSFRSNQSVNLTTANAWVDIGSDAVAFNNNTLDEYYISYPGDNNIYRVSFVTRNAGGGNVNYTMVCEKF